MIQVVTDYPIAFDSPDHLYPEGTAKDNWTDDVFINELEQLCGKRQINILDLGCSGGQFIVDMHERGHLAVGLEGSDFSRIYHRANWPEYDGKVLFTCDVSRSFVVMDGNRPVHFDVITAWEVMEHITPDRLDGTINRIAALLKPDGLFIATINSSDGLPHHINLHPYDWWTQYLSTWFENLPINTFSRYVRSEGYPYVGRKLA